MPYFLRRLLWILPTWGLVSILVFTLSRLTTGDPVALKLGIQDGESYKSTSENAYRAAALEMGAHLPTFYFAILPHFYPDTLHRILTKTHREVAEQWLLKSGDWQAVSALLTSLKKLQNFDESSELSRLVQQFSLQTDTVVLAQLSAEIQQKARNNAQNRAYAQAISAATETIFKAPQKQKYRYFSWPKIVFYGANNQYHHWLSGFLKGDFGMSLPEGIPVSEKMKRPLYISLVLSFTSLILAFLIGIAGGLAAALKHKKPAERHFMRLVFGLYALPTFWIATLAAVFFTTPEYGLKIFPSVGLSDASVGVTSFSTFMGLNFTRFILPILCLSIHPSVVFIRQTHALLVENLSTDFVRTARAKGLSHQQALTRHALPNIALPLITLLGQSLPAVLMGAFTIELIFNISGMGQLIFESIFARNWAVVFTVLMLTTTLILAVNLLTDLLYRYFNPKIFL
jgi:peptide/nickel transport system permease protein